MLWDERSAIQRATLTPSTGLPVEAGMEALTAGFDFSNDEEKSTSLDRALYEEYDSYLDKVEQHTGSRIPNPIGFAPRQFDERPAGMTGQLGNQVRLRRQQEEIGKPQSGMAGFEQKLSEARDLNPTGFPEPPTPGELLDRITSKLGASRERYEDLQSRMTTGGTVASMVGSMGALATDPLVAGTAFIGGPAAGTGLRALAAKMLVEAGIASAGELAVQPYIFKTKEAIESPYTLGDAAANVALAGLVGGGLPVAGALLRAGGRKATRVLDRVFHQDKPLVRPATPTERAALNEVERQAEVEETAPTLPDDVPAHAERFDAEVEAVRETGVPSGRGDLDAPIDAARVADVDEEFRLDDVTRVEIETLAREDADLSRAIDAVESIRAYHGSPHRFDKFSMEKIGTGEGAQAFGRGIYFAENQDIAAGYRKRLAGGGPGDASADPAAYASFRVFADGSRENAVSTIKAEIESINQKIADGMQDYKPVLEARLQTLETLESTGDLPAPGSLYTVDLAVSRDDLLDWDAPLSQQSEKVRKALEDNPDPMISGTAAKYGDNIQSMLDRMAQRMEGGQAELSQTLRAAGIPGIRYLDGGSRADGQGTRNFVMFDEDRITIREINGQPIPDAAVAAKELAEFTGSDAETAILAADVERALGAKAPPEPVPGAPKPAEPPKPTLDPELAAMEVPVDTGVDPFTGESLSGIRTAQDLLDELDADQRTLDAMNSCAAPIPVPKVTK